MAEVDRNRAKVLLSSIILADGIRLCDVEGSLWYVIEENASSRGSVPYVQEFSTWEVSNQGTIHTRFTGLNNEPKYYYGTKKAANHELAKKFIEMALRSLDGALSESIINKRPSAEQCLEYIIKNSICPD